MSKEIIYKKNINITMKKNLRMQRGSTPLFGSPVVLTVVTKWLLAVVVTRLKWIESASFYFKNSLAC